MLGSQSPTSSYLVLFSAQRTVAHLCRSLRPLLPHTKLSLRPRSSLARPSLLPRPQPLPHLSHSRHMSTAMSVDAQDGSAAAPHSDFKLLAEEKLEFADVRIVKWQSESTGLKVVWADVEGK